MKRKVFGLLIAVTLILGAESLHIKAAANVPAYVDSPTAGNYTIGEEKSADREENKHTLKTDFYLYIENPQEEDQAVTVNPGLPQTGDYGMDVNTVLSWALICGAGYLVCEHYAKKNQ